MIDFSEIKVDSDYGVARVLKIEDPMKETNLGRVVRLLTANVEKR